MGRKKKSLHDYAAEFCDLSVKRHIVEQKEGRERNWVEILYCKSCEIPMSARRDRILEHLASARHYRNRRLEKHTSARLHATTLLMSPPVDFAAGMSMLDQSVLPQSSSFVFQPNPCPTSFSNNIPSPVSLQQNMISFRTSLSNSTTNTVTIRHDMATSNSPSGSSPPFNGLQVLGQSHSSRPSGQRHIVPEASNNVVSSVTVGRYGDDDLMGSHIGLALFGVCSGNRALFKSIEEESGCRLLYIVEDCIQDLECAFSTDILANTRVIRGQDTDIVLNDQRVSGIIICSLTDEGSEIILDALRAGKGVFCEKLLSLDKQLAESCFDEAARCGKPLVCGLYKRFDPAVQFLYKKVRNKALGRIQRIVSVSRTYPSPSLSYIKKTGGIFYDGVVHDLDTVCWLLGENAPDTIFSLGHAFCQEIAALKDADTVSVSMKFASGAIVTLDVSQHCTRSSDQRLEVHGSEGTLRMDNQNALGITEQGTARPVCSHLHYNRYKEAYRDMLKHFLKTLKGKEEPFITKENFLWTIQVAAAAEQSWRNGSAVDLRNEALDGTVIKTEVP
ncbi:streptomycin biosynthesis protein StrI-like [Heterodontus francisci]|uniref:streptomycin biosynthesis protein StrI-like n=1 Tax=Heterodontus francisci TaxID=7792 RepID=UPI00355BF050